MWYEGFTGAIDEVKINKNTLKPRISIIGDTKPKICGSGIIDLIAEMFLTGIIDMQGKITQTAKTDRIDIITILDVTVCCSFGTETADGQDITLNEIDINNFLRAKGAVYSGARTLLNSVGLDMSILIK